MSEAHTVGMIPFSPREGVWVESLAKTDPDFLHELAESLPKRTGFMIISDPQTSSYAQSRGVEVIPDASQLFPCGSAIRVGESCLFSSGSVVRAAVLQVFPSRTALRSDLSQLFLSGSVISVQGGNDIGFPTGKVGFANNILDVMPLTSGSQVPVVFSGSQILQAQTIELPTAPAQTTVSLVFCVMASENIAEVVSQSTPPAFSATARLDECVADKEFDAIFRRASEERFEDGMESQFSRDLEALVNAYGSSSKGVLSRLLNDESVPAGVWAEAMRCLGRVDSPSSREARLWLLEKGLTARSPLIRDGAALGLASMDDPSAIPYLQRAIASETLRGLRSDMQEVLSQLTSR